MNQLQFYFWSKRPVLSFFCQVNLAIFVMLLNVVLGKVAAKYNNDKIMKTRYEIMKTYISNTLADKDASFIFSREWNAF